MNQEDRKYYLVVRHGKNSFLPVDWTQTSFYDGEDLFSLSGIDSFTSKVVSIDLLKECVQKNLLSINDSFSSFEILYIEHEVNHTIKEGPIFREDDYVLSEDELIEFIIENLNNKDKLNNILMQCNIKETDENLETFKMILKNITNIELPIEKVREHLSFFKKLTYLQKRTISMRVSNNIIYKEEVKKKEKYLQNEGKVA